MTSDGQAELTSAAENTGTVLLSLLFRLFLLVHAD